MSMSNGETTNQISAERQVSGVDGQTEGVDPAGTEKKCCVGVESKEEPEELVRVPGDWDVLMGRGALSTDFPGNLRFRKLVKKRRHEYIHAKRRIDKQGISSAIIATVRAHGGRFLHRVEQTLDNDTNEDANDAHDAHDDDEDDNNNNATNTKIINKSTNKNKHYNKSKNFYSNTNKNKGEPKKAILWKPVTDRKTLLVKVKQLMRDVGPQAKKKKMLRRDIVRFQQDTNKGKDDSMSDISVEDRDEEGMLESVQVMATSMHSKPVIIPPSLEQSFSSSSGTTQLLPLSPHLASISQMQNTVTPLSASVLDKMARSGIGPMPTHLGRPTAQTRSTTSASQPIQTLHKNPPVASLLQQLQEQQAAVAQTKALLEQQQQQQQLLQLQQQQQQLAMASMNEPLLSRRSNLSLADTLQRERLFQRQLQEERLKLAQDRLLFQSRLQSHERGMGLESIARSVPGMSQLTHLHLTQQLDPSLMLASTTRYQHPDLSLSSRFPPYL